MEKNKNKNPKITHFAESDATSAGDSNGLPDRSDLGVLYPEAKTYEQLSKDKLRRAEMFKKRLPKHPGLNIAMYGSVVFLMIIFLLHNLESLWMSGNITVIFFSFAVWMILGYAVISWAKYTNELFYSAGGLVRKFWIIYIAALMLISAIMASGWLGQNLTIFSAFIFTVLHFILIIFGVRATLTEV